MNDEQKFLSCFEQAIDTLEPGALKMESRYKELPIWDSLAVLTLTDEIDSEYGVLLRRADFEATDTVSELLARLLERQSGKP